MAMSSRTILTEYVNGSLTLGRSYSICGNRLPGSGGCNSATIEARVIDNHYLIMKANVSRNFVKTPLAIVDMDKPEVAQDRMYQEAMNVAVERAEFDKNKVIDITSRNTKISENDKCFVGGMARKELMMS